MPDGTITQEAPVSPPPEARVRPEQERRINALSGDLGHLNTVIINRAYTRRQESAGLLHQNLTDQKREEIYNADPLLQRLGSINVLQNLGRGNGYPSEIPLGGLTYEQAGDGQTSRKVVISKVRVSDENPDEFICEMTIDGKPVNDINEQKKSRRYIVAKQMDAGMEDLRQPGVLTNEQFTVMTNFIRHESGVPPEENLLTQENVSAMETAAHQSALVTVADIQTGISSTRNRSDLTPEARADLLRIGESLSVDNVLASAQAVEDIITALNPEGLNDPAVRKATVDVLTNGTIPDSQMQVFTGLVDALKKGDVDALIRAHPDTRGTASDPKVIAAKERLKNIAMGGGIVALFLAVVAGAVVVAAGATSVGLSGQIKAN